MILCLSIQRVIFVERRMLFTWRGTLFLTMVVCAKSELYLFDTEDGLQVEYYDCFLVQSLSYCRRPDQPIDLIRDNQTSSCQQNGGQLHQFSELQSNKTMISTILHRWKSGIERVEEYSRYQRNISAIDGYLCQCTEASSFGKDCEYRLPFGETFGQTFDWRLKMRQEIRCKCRFMVILFAMRRSTVILGDRVSTGERSAMEFNNVSKG